MSLRSVVGLSWFEAGHNGAKTDEEGASKGTDTFPLMTSVLLQPRSLVVFREQAFTDCLHSIDEVMRSAGNQSWDLV